MRSPLTEVNGKRRGGLVDACVLERCLDDHFAREFHAIAGQSEVAEGFLRDCAQAAMRIVDTGAKEQVEDARECGIADVPVFPGHRAGGDAALKARSHAKLRSVE